MIPNQLRMGSFKNLRVWQAAHRVTVSVYLETKSFPKDELYGLTSQMRRASASIGANIAEGCGRNGDRELARFLRIALGSANELQYHILLAEDLEYLTPLACTQLDADVTVVKRMLAKLMARLSR
jgi:four helix bundle protein